MNNVKSDITVILTGYKRPDNLNLQIEALNNQTIKPDYTFCWYNHPPKGFPINQQIQNLVVTAMCNTNFGVWSRFLFALNAPTKYVCVLDDDTIPGKRWLENCLNTIKIQRGLLVGIGIYCFTNKLFVVKDKMKNTIGLHDKYGWSHINNTDIKEVDYGGQSWFFEKQWLKHFVQEYDSFNDNLLLGEDMYFSYILKKHNIKTFVPPHPKDNKELWSSIKGELGLKNSSFSYNQLTQMNNALMKLVMYGNWKLMFTQIKGEKDFKKEFYRIINIIKSKKNMVLFRFGDGEVKIIKGEEISQNTQAYQQDKWSVKQGETKFGKTLLEIVKKYNNHNCFLLIPCKCCDLEGKIFLTKNLNIPNDQISFASLFVNSNYKLTLEFFKQLDEEIIVIANHKGKNNKDKFPFKIKDYLEVPDDCVNLYNEGKVSFEAYIKNAKQNSNTLFLISAGPLAKLIIDKMYQANTNNRYIDVGSCIDEFVYQRKTRPYQIENTYYNKMDCIF